MNINIKILFICLFVIVTFNQLNGSSNLEKDYQISTTNSLPSFLSFSPLSSSLPVAELSLNPQKIQQAHTFLIENLPAKIAEEMTNLSAEFQRIFNIMKEHAVDQKRFDKTIEVWGKPAQIGKDLVEKLIYATRSSKVKYNILEENSLEEKEFLNCLAVLDLLKSYAEERMLQELPPEVNGLLNIYDKFIKNPSDKTHKITSNHLSKGGVSSDLPINKILDSFTPFLDYVHDMFFKSLGREARTISENKKIKKLLMNNLISEFVSSPILTGLIESKSEALIGICNFISKIHQLYPIIEENQSETVANRFTTLQNEENKHKKKTLNKRKKGTRGKKNKNKNSSCSVFIEAAKDNHVAAMEREEEAGVSSKETLIDDSPLSSTYSSFTIDSSTSLSSSSVALSSLSSSSTFPSKGEDKKAVIEASLDLPFTDKLLPTGFNKKDIDFITQEIFDLKVHTINSNDVFNFLVSLVKKQRDLKIPAEFREGRGSHKLAILISQSGKKFLFPFAHHPGKKLDRHSRSLIISGFETLLG